MQTNYKECRPLIGNTYDGKQQVKQEIDLVMAAVGKSTTQILPLYGKKNVSKKQFHDMKLQRLCDDSKKTWSECVSAGCPATGGLFSKKNYQESSASTKKHPKSN